MLWSVVFIIFGVESKNKKEIWQSGRKKTFYRSDGNKKDSKGSKGLERAAANEYSVLAEEF